MIARASGALLFAYIVMMAAGLVFLFVPSQPVSEAATYTSTLVLWSLFYVVGGGLAAFCIIARRFVRNATPLWYFEVGGISLVVAANLVYSYALASSAITSGALNSLASSLVILAFSGGLIARSIETLRLVRTLKQFSTEGDNDG